MRCGTIAVGAITSRPTIKGAHMKRAIAGFIGVLLAGAMTFNAASAMTVAEEYGWYYDTSGQTTESSTNTDFKCGTGYRMLCSSTVTTKCVQWQSTSGTIGISPTGATVGGSTTCAVTVVTTTYQYYD
jgi:hypothetical protein